LRSGYVPTQVIADRDAERHVIGIMLLSPEQAIPEAVEVLTPGDFYDINLGELFSLLIRMHLARTPIDATSVLGSMDQELRGRIGQAPGLFSLIEDAPRADHVRWHATTVADKALRRRLEAAGIRTIQLAHSEGNDSAVLAERAQDEVAAVVRSRTTIEEAADRFAAYMPRFGVSSRGLPLPWGCLTQALGGLVGGRMYVVAARPGVGKSIFATQVAVDLGRHGAVSMHSLEMSEEEIFQRIAASLGRIELDRILGKTPMDQHDYDRISYVHTQLETINLTIDDRSTLTPVDIRAQARKVERAKGPLAGIVVDYLQLMQSSTGDRENRQQEVTEISRLLKNMARDLNVPVVALSQLNRGVELRASKRPVLADLRESGAIEQDADVVLFLYPEMMDHPESGEQIEAPDVINVLVEKNRHGAKGMTFKFTRQGHHSRLIEQQHLGRHEA
jgi:replicative DNA helicase